MLKSEKLGGGGQAKSEVIKQLDQSVKYLHHILHDSHHLKDEIYDKVNALTKEEFLQNSLRVRKSKDGGPYV